MWSDLISVFILGYHAITYCGGYIATACTEEASASSQLIYAAAAIPIAGLLKHLAEDSGLTKRAGMYGNAAARRWSPVAVRISTCPHHRRSTDTAPPTPARQTTSR